MARSGQVLKPLLRLPSNPHSCWPWMGAIDANGYARKTINSKDMTGQRYVWSVLFGDLPDEWVVGTSCGNRACGNPYHLRAYPTLADAQRNGGGATITPSDFAEIKVAKKHRTPHMAAKLAAKFGVNPAAIRCIWRGRTWASTRSRRPAAPTEETTCST